ncbi:MAG: ornithine cyclodeaminase family protein, partial [Acidimicrobiaceae bacterium]|nr:ornithine cyclodeaminase family protein [Acidimicrobiaceae bacterium]
MLVIDNKAVSELLDVRDAVGVLEQAYKDLATGEGICRPRIDMRIPAGDGRSIYQWGTMEGGSARSGYFAIRMKSDVLTEESKDGNRTQEKYCIQPGTFMGLV